MKKEKTHVGIDIGKKRNFFCMMDKDGNVLRRGKYPNTRADAALLAREIAVQYDAEVVCESTAGMWIKTYEEFERCGISVSVANPLRLKMSQSGAKTDKIDAEKLANRLRMKDIPTVHVRPAQSRRTLDILHQRFTLVGDRTRVINRQHAILDKYDYNTSVGNGNTSGAKYQQYINGLKLNSGDTRIMMQLVRQVTYLNGEIDILDKLIAKNAYRSEDAIIIMSLPGFGYLSSLFLAISIDGIERFAGPKQLVSYLGLCPRVYQSGDRTVHGRMKKDKNGKLTWIMMNSAMIAHSHDEHLGELYERYSKRHVPLVARSHLANKLGIYIYQMLTKRALYQFYNKDLYKTKMSRLKTLSGN